MKKRGIAIMLIISMLSLAACDAAPAATTAATEPTQAATIPTTAATEPTEPDDGSLKFYYDDRISFADLGGTESSTVTVLEQTVESRKVGSDQPDDAVLFYDEAGHRFIAVGVGTATVDVDGTQVLVRVRTAPISLFMITGSSSGSGQCGNGAQSVMCEAGQAYSCYKTATFTGATNDMGLGYGSAVRPQGIDAFMPGGGGTLGEGSAMAWKWNQLTGEKVWVLNAAVGGSVIPEWHKGQMYYEPAVSMYRAAAHVLKNEAAAGHYTLKNTAVIYHSGGNFDYKKVEFTDEIMEYWYDSLYYGLLEDLAIDIDGNGEKETLQALAFLPGRSVQLSGKYPNDQPINYYMSLSDQYPGCFMATNTVRFWAAVELLQNFPDIDYTTQSQPVEKPTNKAELIAEDGVHFLQVAYNAVGIGIGESLYAHFRNQPQTVTFTVRTPDGRAINDTLKLKKVGLAQTLVVEAEPYYASDFTIELSDNLELSSPFTVKATAEGEGYIKFSRNGQVLHTITVTVGN